MGLRRVVETDEMVTSNHDENVAEAKLKLILRIWRRRSSKKRELREQMQLATRAALSSLSLGPTIWHYKDVLDERNAYKIGPDHCITAFTEASDKSMEKVAAAANANPACWPSPEIAYLEESGDEHGALALYLPIIGWSSSAGIKPLMATLSYFKLPAFPDDISWLYKGSDMGGDIEEQRLQLEKINHILDGLTQSSQMMGSSLARKEARVMLQKCTRLELHGRTYYLIPKWVTIFRRVFSWQLTSLSNGPFSSAYVLEQHSVATQTSGGLENLGFEGSISSPYYLIHPSLNEWLKLAVSLLRWECIIWNMKILDLFQ